MADELYFQYPWNGGVYKIIRHLSNGEYPVRLPTGEVIGLAVQDGYFPRPWEISDDAIPTGEPISCQQVYKSGEDEQTVTGAGDWDRLIPLINAAAAANTLFTVHLSLTEYQRLAGGAYAELERRFSERARNMLELMEASWHDNQPALELTHTCSGRGCR